jgi:RNA recognition motif-containing protein
VSKPPAPQRQVFIGNLSFDATEKELADGLEFAGIHVFRVRIATNQETGKSRGFAFVDIDRDDPKSVGEIIEIINQGEIELHGRAIRADQANTRARPEKRTEDAPSRTDRPHGGRGHGRNEFQRSRSEFEEG